MRRFNILYDRLRTGEFFQFYTLPFEQRFFFEVVQRSGSYDLYGASNARPCDRQRWRIVTEASRRSFLEEDRAMVT